VKVAWLSPGDPTQRTGGYLWNARLAAALRARGVEVEVAALPGAWPRPGLAAPDALADLAADVVVADGLCWPGTGAAGAALAARLPVVVVVHALLARETGVDPALAPALDAWERAAWAPARGLVVTSARTRAQLGAVGVPVAEVIPGTDRTPRAAGGDGWTILTVGTLTRRKGHDALLEALGRVPGPWRLRCAGEARDPAWAADLRARVSARGWDARVTFLGALGDEALAAEFAAADVVAHAARDEAFGMALTEAVARGLAVVTTPAGAVDHLPPGAVVVAHDLGPPLAGLLGDPAARRAQADRAWAAAATLPSWDDQAGVLAAALAAWATARPANGYLGRSGGAG
jgi:glycosyltransferase involved in cell wall biosynthesis